MPRKPFVGGSEKFFDLKASILAMPSTEKDEFIERGRHREFVENQATTRGGRVGKSSGVIAGHVQKGRGGSRASDRKKSAE